ncbi:MAG: hypothetical protein K2Y22_06765 [Candidatus Obscuribacterales bacterium]|nr:hypothetical protein [Candidatus Obscuribacterales bacterium]
MTEKPNDQDAQSQENSCAAEILDIPQDVGEPCFYCADEHPQQQAVNQPKKRDSKKPKTKKPVELPPQKKGNWFSQLSFPWKLLAVICGLASVFGLGHYFTDLPKPSPAACAHQIVAPNDGAITVAQADSSGKFTRRTTYQYEVVSGVKQLVSAKTYTNEGKPTATLTFTRDASGDSCLIQLAIYDVDGKVSQLYSDTKLPDSQLLIDNFDLWVQFGQLN